MSRMQEDVKVCCNMPSSCGTPEECLSRKETEQLCDVMLSLAPLSESEMAFLRMFFSLNQDESSLHEISLVYGMRDETEVVLRIAILLGRLHEHFSMLGVGADSLALE